MQGRRIMVLSRDDLLPDAKLVSVFEESGGAVEVSAGSGYAAMMEAPHDAIPPTATGTVIVEFLQRDWQVRASEAAGDPGAESVLTESAGKRTAAIEEAGSHVLETICTFGRSPASVFGILSEPAAEVSSSGLCLLFLNPGSARHIGSNRMWVEAARRWAGRGIPSLRMDFGGIGESDGKPLRDIAGLYEPELLDDIEAAMASARSRFGVRRFVVIGLCSGAFWAFHAAIRYPDVCGAILLNPRLFFWDPEVDRRRILRRMVNGFTDSKTWGRLARGKITRCRLTLVFTEGEPLLLEMEEEGQLPPEDRSRIRCIRIANCGHTFRPLWAQQLVHELIDREFDAVLRETAPVLKDHSAKIPG